MATDWEEYDRGVLERAEREMGGFTKVTVRPGKIHSVDFQITPQAIADGITQCHVM